MRKGIAVSCLCPLWFSLCGVAAAEWRPGVDVQREAGLYFSAESLRGSTWLLLSPTFAYTRPLSTEVDLKFDAWATALGRGADRRLSLLLAPGFAYWLDDGTRVTARARLGADQSGSPKDSSLVVGGDLLAERFVALAWPGPRSSPDYLVPALALQAQARHRLGLRPRFGGWAELRLGYDWQLRHDASARIHWRGKVTAAAALAVGDDASWNERFSATLSLQDLDTASGRLKAKYEVCAASDFASFWRVTLGVARSF